MTDLGLGERLALARQLAPLQELILLDGIWTDAIEGESKSGVRSLDHLRELGARMDDLVGQAAETAAQLEMLFVSNEQLVEDVCAKLVTSDNVAAEHRKHLERHLQSPRASRLAELMRMVVRQGPAEQETIKQKLQSMERTGTAEGDLGPEFMCGLCIGLAIGAGVAEAWPAAFVAAAAAGVYCAQV